MKTYKLFTKKTFQPSKNTYILGIDPGTRNGVSLYNIKTHQFEYAVSLSFWELFDFLTSLLKENSIEKVIIEDIIGNKITFQRNLIYINIKRGFKELAMAVGIFDKRAQDVGGNKRDELHIIEWLENNKIEIIRRVPKKNSKTKLTAQEVKNLTGIQSTTNEHSRDSIMLIYNYLQEIQQ